MYHSYEWCATSTSSAITAPSTSTTTPSHSPHVQLRATVRARALVAATTSPAITAAAITTWSCERIAGASTHAATASATDRRVGRISAPASSQSASADQKYASDSGMSTPVSASDGIATVATAAMYDASRDRKRRASP